MRNAQGDGVSAELEGDCGCTWIEGTTMLSSFHIGNPRVNRRSNQQGAGHHRWDGQAVVGMIERSSPADLCTVDGWPVAENPSTAVCLNASPDRKR